MLPEVRMARIIDAIGLHQARKLSCVEAGALLGMSDRHSKHRIRVHPLRERRPLSNRARVGQGQWREP